MKTPTSPKQAAIGDTIVVALGPENGSDHFDASEASDDSELLLVKAEPRPLGHHTPSLPKARKPQQVGATLHILPHNPYLFRLAYLCLSTVSHSF